MKQLSNIQEPTVQKLWNKNYLKIWIGNFLIHFSFTLIVPLLRYLGMIYYFLRVRNHFETNNVIISYEGQE